MFLLLLLLIFFAVFCFVFYLMPDEEELEARKRIEKEQMTSPPRSLFFHIARFLFPTFLPFAKRFKLERYRSKKKKQMISAGLRGRMDTDEFIATKLALAVILPILPLVLLRGLYWKMFLPLGITLGFFFPDLWLYDMLKTRKKKILRSMPYVVDLLTLSVEAGLDFSAAIGRIVKKAKEGPLVEEFHELLQEIRMGSTRSDALRHLAERIDLTDMNSFCSILIQADQLGSSIGPVLRTQADKMRTERFQKAEREGAAASQKILFPLVLFIFPAVFIIIMGIVVLKFVYGG